MTAVPQPSASADRDTDDTTPRYTIGEVLSVLRGHFPEVTISKIRYLESEELVHPQRTPSGYRKFSGADVARLRYVLAAQRDQYLPLRVIKEQLDALDRGEPVSGRPAGDGGGPTGAGPIGDGPTGQAAAGEDAAGQAAAREGAPGGPVDTVPLAAAEFARAAGLTDDLLADCVQFGLVGPDPSGRLPAGDLPIARAVAGLAGHGIEPRHLRVYRTAVEREAALLEQLVAPVLRARSEDAHTRAGEQLQQLAGLSAQLHSALLGARLREVLGG